MIYIFRMKLEDRIHVKAPVILESKFACMDSAFLEWTLMFVKAGILLKEGYIVTEISNRAEEVFKDD